MMFVAIKLGQSRVKAPSDYIDMGTVTCDQCGERFGIGHHLPFKDHRIISEQVAAIEALLADNHQRAYPHPDSIGL